MYLVKMRPEQIQDHVRRNVPVLMAAGVVEFHGPHLPVGTDYLIAAAICEAVEQRCECVLAPPFPFGPTMSWAAGPEEGEVDFEPEPFFQYARSVLRHLLKLGFRRIYVLQHHQGPEGLQSLCLQRAAREIMWEMARQWEPGWGRKPVPPEPAIFDCIRIAGLDSFSSYPSAESERVPVGHAGKGETQLIMAAYPETVRMEALRAWQGSLPEWLADAWQGKPDEGKRWLEFCIQGWVKELSH
jgi:creatinine amidohydrolase